MSKLAPVTTFGSIIAAHFKHLDDKEYVVLIRTFNESDNVQQIELAQVETHKGERVPAISDDKNVAVVGISNTQPLDEVFESRIMPEFNEFLASKAPATGGGDTMPDNLSQVEQWVWFFQNRVGYNPQTGQFEKAA